MSDRTAEQIKQAHNACLVGASAINAIIATYNKGSDASGGSSDTAPDFGYELTTDEKKEKVARSVGYLKYQKENFDDWGSEDFTVIDKAITDADNFIG